MIHEEWIRLQNAYAPATHWCEEVPGYEYPGPDLDYQEFHHGWGRDNYIGPMIYGVGKYHQPGGAHFYPTGSMDGAVFKLGTNSMQGFTCHPAWTGCVTEIPAAGGNGGRAKMNPYDWLMIYGALSLEVCMSQEFYLRPEFTNNCWRIITNHEYIPHGRFDGAALSEYRQTQTIQSGTPSGDNKRFDVIPPGWREWREG